MEIYVKVISEFHRPCWYRHERDSGCGSYLEDGSELEAIDALGYEYLRGSAAKSWKEAKSWAKDAKMLANVDGFGKSKVSFWKWHNGKCVKVQPSSRK